MSIGHIEYVWVYQYIVLLCIKMEILQRLGYNSLKAERINIPSKSIFTTMDKKVVIITGASAGIGVGIADYFAEIG